MLGILEPSCSGSGGVPPPRGLGRCAVWKGTVCANFNYLNVRLAHFSAKMNSVILNIEAKYCVE